MSHQHLPRPRAKRGSCVASDLCDLQHMVQQLQHRMTVWHRMVYDQATNPLAVVQVVHLKKWHYESLGKTNCNPKSPKLCPKHRPSDPPNGRFQDLFHEDGCLTGDVAYVACMPWPKNPQTRLGPTRPDSAHGLTLRVWSALLAAHVFIQISSDTKLQDLPQRPDAYA